VFIVENDRFSGDFCAAPSQKIGIRLTPMTDDDEAPGVRQYANFAR